MSKERAKELAVELASEISNDIKHEVKKLGKKTFNMGGVHPEANKFAHSAEVVTFPLPDQAVVYMTQHLGAPAKPIVEKGDKVKVGQLIAEANGFVSANIHAPISGTVSKIDMIADISGYKKPAIVIDREGDEWDESIDTTPDIIRDIKLGKDEIIARMKDRGIVGLGGACFPTHIKYMLKPEQKCEYLIINAAECEPYISTDNRVILERTEQCMIGIECALIASGAEKAIIGIEDNKPQAIAALVEMAKKFTNIEVQPLKIKYPQGAEKQLIKAITGRSVPNGALPISVGCIVNNITTMYVLYQAVQKNKPIVQAYTTVSGKSIPKEQCKIFRLRLGIPIRDVLNRRHSRRHRQDHLRRPDDGQGHLQPRRLRGQGYVQFPLYERKGEQTRSGLSLHPLRQVRQRLPDGTGIHPAVHPLPTATVGRLREKRHYELHRVRLLLLHLPLQSPVLRLYPGGQGQDRRDDPRQKRQIEPYSPIPTI